MFISHILVYLISTYIKQENVDSQIEEAQIYTMQDNNSTTFANSHTGGLQGTCGKVPVEDHRAVTLIFQAKKPALNEGH